MFIKPGLELGMHQPLQFFTYHSREVDYMQGFCNIMDIVHVTLLLFFQL